MTKPGISSDCETSIPVEIRGSIRDDRREELERWLRSASCALELAGLRVHVGRSWRLPRHLEAGASRKGIWLRERIMDLDSSWLGFVASEEAAHHKLILVGVPEGTQTFLGALLHESFGNWFAYRHVVERDPTIAARMLAMPLPAAFPDVELGYKLGGVVGVAAAGNAGVERRLRGWVEEGRLDAGLKGAVVRVQRTLTSGDRPAGVAERLARMYRGTGS